MPLSSLQSDILRVISSFRDPESYVAGGTPLNREAERYSSDIDIFHDREERVVAAALKDAQALESAGFEVRWLRRFPAIYTAEIARSDQERTRLEWVVDSDFRFFPTMTDPAFGFVLHPVDLALNKVMAAAGRRAVRDLVDLRTAHRRILPLGALIWAVVEKSPGFTPEGLLAELRRNSHYPVADWKALDTTVQLDPGSVMGEIREMFNAAEAFVSVMPSEKAGLLFLQDGKPVEPDPSHLSEYATHAGQRRGHWPGSAAIDAAMFESYGSTPE